MILFAIITDWFSSSWDSQLEDENHIRSVFEHVVQGHDVGVLDLLQDVHLPLDLLSSHATPAGPALPLLDELGGVFDARASVLAAFDDGKLPAGDANAEEKQSRSFAYVRHFHCEK